MLPFELVAQKDKRQDAIEGDFHLGQTRMTTSEPHSEGTWRDDEEVKSMIDVKCIMV